MRRTSNRPGPRPGFTLVELLVVITIIAILTALTAAAVVKAIAKADEVKTRNEISQLALGVQSFKTDFSVGYVPSRITIPPAYDLTGESTQYISSVWPRINANYLATGPTAFTAWGMSGTNQPVTLSGDQCLVFFLGGVRVGANSFGFSTNPNFPMNPPAASGEVRKGPYFDFPPNRLVAVSHGASPTPSASDQLFPSFIDTYASLPYLYFSSRKAGNDYPTDPTTNQVYPIQIAGTYTVYPFQITGVPPNSGSAGVRVWANKGGFQIISGGKDTLFHDSGNYAGGLIWPGGGGGTDMGGYDNMCNFHPTLLGVPAN